MGNFNMRIFILSLFFLLSVTVSCKKDTASPVVSEEDDAFTQEINLMSVPTILFMGDSLTAGYGLDPGQAYPALIGVKLAAGGKKYDVMNAGVSGDTTSAGLNRIQWHLDPAPKAMVLALGANDGLRGIDPNVTKKNLSLIITIAKEKNPNIKILLVGMKAPPNMGKEYVEKFEALYPELAKEHQLPLVPFLLEGVAAQPTMNLEDGIHPNEKGQQAIADHLWPHLKPLL